MYLIEKSSFLNCARYRVYIIAVCPSRLSKNVKIVVYIMPCFSYGITNFLDNLDRPTDIYARQKKPK